MAVNMNMGQPVGSLTRDGHYSVLLWWYPKASTPGCTMEGKKFNELYQQFKDKMCLVVGVSNNDTAANGAFCKECAFKFPLICDTTMEIAVAYGAAKDTSQATANRMAVLVDRDGNVAKVWPSVDAATFPETALKELPEPPPLHPLKELNGLRIPDDEVKYRSGPYPMPASMVEQLKHKGAGFYPKP